LKGYGITRGNLKVFASFDVNLEPDVSIGNDEVIVNSRGDPRRGGIYAGKNIKRIRCGCCQAA
jgi:hypothetical protein